MKGLIGKKVGMTQLFDDAGKAVPVTVIKAGPCFVTQVRTVDKDGYSAVQLGFDETKPQRLTGGELGHLKKNELPPLRILREFRTDETLEEGQALTVEVFEEGERVDIIGKSKGRGFAGVVKRYGFAGGPKTHGQSDRHRAPGSIGAGSTPGRVYKGKKMPGRMGTDTVTSQNLLVSRIDPENNIIAVRGSVPGPRNGLVIIKEARKQ
ncbi:MAG: 50S ribosomal protein L3 [Anaerolineales bacterium]|nr:MAG: 50S ribosomal protein L3 [Anaerolineales bacterium]